MHSIAEKSGTEETEEDQPDISKEEEFIPIGARGNVQWKYITKKVAFHLLKLKMFF